MQQWEGDYLRRSRRYMTRGPYAFDPFEGRAAADYERDRSAVAIEHRSALDGAEAHTVRLSEWDGGLSKRRIRIYDRELILECFGTPSSTKRLIVLLTGGGGRAAGPDPVFHRVIWHPWLDAVCVNIDDPTFAAYPGQLDTGWYLGTESQDAVQAVVAAISRIQSHYAIMNEDVLVVGSSAGGTAALKIASGIPGATAIAENPPIYPHLRPTATMFESAGLDIRDGVFRDRNRLDLILKHPQSRFFIIQNFADRGTTGHFEEFLNEASYELPGVGLTRLGAVYLYLTSVPARSPHHTFMSVTEMRSIISIVGRNVGFETQRIVLDSAYESMRARVLMTERLQGVRVWARIISEMRVPALERPPVPADGNNYSIALRTNPAVSYRLRISHDSKNVALWVLVDPRYSRANVEEVRQVASSIDAEVTEVQGVMKIVVSRTPIGRVANRLKSFVDATSGLFSAQ